MPYDFRTYLWLTLLSILLILFLGFFMGRVGIFLALALSLILNLGSYYFSDYLVLSMYRAQEVDYLKAPYIHQVVEELAERAHLPKPKIYLVSEEAPNAFACGRDPNHAAIVVTEGLLKVLSPEALQGALGHEMAHILKRDTLIQTITSILATSIISLANLFNFEALLGKRNNPLSALLLALLAPISATLIQLAISRDREYQADALGARLCGRAENLALALETLEELSCRIPLKNGNPATSQIFMVQPSFGLNETLERLFDTHPPLKDRIYRLRKKARS